MDSLEQRLLAHAGLIFTVFGILFVAGVFADVALWKRLRASACTMGQAVFRVSWRPWDWIDVVVPLCIIFPAESIVYLVAKRIEGWPAERKTLVLMALQTLAFHGVIVAYAALSAWRRRIPIRSAFGGGSARFLHDVGTGALFYIAMIPPMLLLLLINAGILKLFNIDASSQEIIGLFAETPSVRIKFFIMLLAVLVAPVAEETFFRGIGLPALLKHFSPAAAIAIVSAVFAGVHFHIPAFLPLFALSCGFCCAYIVTESLVVSMTMHAIFNAMTTTLVLIASQ